MNVDLHDRRPEINLGDLCRALGELKDASEEEKQIIARCLGFHLGQHKQATVEKQPYRPRKAAYNRHSLKKKIKQQLTLPGLTSKIGIPPKPEVPPELSGNEIPITFNKIDDAPDSSAPAISEHAIHNSKPLEIDLKPHAVSRCDLFSDNTARAKLSLTAMQPTSGDELDLSKLIRMTVSGQMITKFPTRPNYSPRNGCQLLLDFNKALMPWWPDMQTLIQQFIKLMGVQQCQVYEFTNDPADAYQWTEQEEIPWQPNNNKAVILASDLGMITMPHGNPRMPTSTWLKFAECCHRAQVPVIGLVPINPTRYPLEVDRHFKLIHWHPMTTAAMIKRRIQDA